MTFPISQRGKEYFETARTLLRAAQNMTDRAIADQLKAFADDCQRRSACQPAPKFDRRIASPEDVTFARRI
jgi:hypothetical protein